VLTEWNFRWENCKIWLGH